MGFEQRLARALVVACGALGACAGTTTKSDSGTHSGTPGTLAGICDGDPPPADHLLTFGWVMVEPGTPCPDPAAAQLEVHGCTFLEWQHITCAFDHVDADQVLVNDGYGGHFEDAATAGGTGIASDPVDVCYYQGVFYLPPDHPTCGRPLLADDGRPLVAGIRADGPDDGWSEGAPPDPTGLDAAGRAEVGAYWLRSAALEHASVASFARFSTDLLRFGAPPDLLRDAHRAAMDEVGHATACFALAGAYRGAPVAPGPLQGAWPTPPATAADLAEAVVREGCVGETLAALDAGARLAGAVDPAVRAVLARIVREESAHAALAWRTLRWLLAGDADGAVRARVDAVLADARRAVDLPPAGPEPTPAEVAHGLVPPGVRARVLRLAWDGVITASWAELSAGPGPARA